MIELDVQKIQVNSFNDYFVIYIEGEFHDLTPHEYRFVTFTPHNILYEKDVKIDYKEYYFQATIVETEMIPRKFFPFLKKKIEKIHNITINSYNNAATYAFLLPYYDASFYGTFRFELIVTKEEFKRVQFRRTLEDL